LDEHPVWSIDLRDSDAPPVRTEWVLTNGVGGFAMGTVPGVPTRRYHGLLVAAMKPPVLRVLTLAAVDDSVEIIASDGTAETFRLTPFHFVSAPERASHCPYLVRFEKDDVARWIYELPTRAGPVTVTKTLELGDGRNAAVLRYQLPEGVDAALRIRPLVAMRDFHALLTGHEPDLHARELPGMLGSPGVLLTRRRLGMHLVCRGANEFNLQRQEYRGIEFIVERERGLDDHEDWSCPGEFVARGSRVVELMASVDTEGRGEWEDARHARRRRRRGMIDATLTAAHRPEDARCRSRLAQLAAAADDFVVQRAGSAPGKTTILAGYPWFADWGRDTMIALPGLLLTTGRHEEAFDVLRTFAGAQRRGMIPNRFDDHAGPAHYNTVDASLWFIHACVAWLDATGDDERFAQHLRPACERVVEAYLGGTDYNIKVDPIDGLVAAGSHETQLTWMDARRDGVVFTPRYGKPVEINALWVHGLRSLERATRAIGGPDSTVKAQGLAAHADQATEGFRGVFLNGPAGGLVDCITPEQESRAVRWQPSMDLRPNQVFAASLAHAPLETGERRAVVGAIRAHLLTPAGLRTLSPEAPAYEPKYHGPLFDRDRAYHNGTVWPWLLGSFCEALMRSESFSDASKTEARERLLTLADALDAPSVGQLSEIADAEAGPNGHHRFDGCPAQAWSIAETLRVLVLSQQNRTQD
jgi:predicted glycogen debranching enzyme